MPFKIRLKKSRHYSVASKSLFIISVEALDNTFIECTLSSESTGQECLECACQKLSVNQPHFFGLQYLSREEPDSNTLCWLELDRPVKRQLDKHAGRMLLHMRVMFYVVSGVKLITDELARYHYFLQLKMDVIEGRIVCNPKQAVQLASYCMQAEFGNYDAEKHTPDYLKDFQLFPKSFTDLAMIDSLTNAAIHQHAALHNLPQGTAEEHFITTCQQLEGYGIETFHAHDHHDNEILLGISLTGISIQHLDGRLVGKFYGWMDVSNVVSHKKLLSLECVTPSESVQFHFTEVDGAKQAFRTAVLQNMFFRKYEADHVSTNSGQSEVHTVLPIFHQVSNIVQDDKNKINHDNNSDLYSVNNYHHTTQQQQQQPDIGITHRQLLSQRAQSTSCLDLTTSTSTDIDRLRNLLPSYRPAPDYETAVQQKYRNSAGALPSEHHQQRPTQTHSFIYSSQPEIHQQQARVHYPDVTHGAVYRATAAVAAATPITAAYNRSVLDLAEGLHLLHLYKPPPPYPSNRLTSNSTPDLAASSQVNKPQALFVSTQVSGSSPDLVSSGTFLNHHYLKQFYQQQQQQAYVSTLAAASSNSTSRNHNTHGTYENLTSVFDGAAGNIVYCVPAATAAVTRQQHHGSAEPIYENIPAVQAWQAQAQSEENHLNLARMRSRTQSIQSAPEVSHGSRENLYANIFNNDSLSKDKLHQHNSSTNNLLEINNGALNRSTHNLNITQTISSYNSSGHLDTTGSQADRDSFNRKNTFTKKQQLQHDLSQYSSMFNDSGHSTAPNTSMDISGSSSTSSGKKRRRWALLGGGKNKEKEKSATLGREKTKKNENNIEPKQKYRWSTGLPRLQPLPPTISKETMCQLLEQKLHDTQLFFEFDNIAKKKPNAEFTTALHPYNVQFNRFKDVLPYEENRVRLTPTKDNKFGYINASHITASVGSRQRFYIAAQGPTVHTLSSFWHCVWEAEVYLIVQLTDSTEDLSYLPDSTDRCVDIGGGQYQLWWELSQHTGYCITSKVRLCHVASRRYRAIWHLHYTDWGDQGCPHSVSHFLGFLEELRSVRQHTLSDIPPGHNKNPPALVHCTAGVGRTGLTILADLLLYTLDHNQELNVPRVVTQLRHQRAYTIQTVAQYRFVYTLLIHYLKQTRLI